MTGPIIPCVRGFQTPKRGEAPETCRDAWRSNHRQAGRCPPSRLRLAIADGASTTSGSGLWAQCLVNAAMDGVAPWAREAYRTRVLERLRAQWQVRARTLLPQPSSWFAEAALDRGAFSTYLKVEVQDTVWRAEGWGDSCLFHLRQGVPLRVLPDLEPEAFEENPFLLASVPGHDEHLTKQMVRGSGSLLRGDLLLLATDALACWLLGNQPWAETLRDLKGIANEAAFESWVEELREKRGLKNDDTTLVVVEFR